MKNSYQRYEMKKLNPQNDEFAIILYIDNDHLTEFANELGTEPAFGFYMGDNQFISATNSKGIAPYSMDNSYWSKYYVGAKRIY